MATIVKNEIKYNHTFDAKTKRHYVNGLQSVLHCHHYMTLYLQLALDANETELLKDCARDSFRQILDNYSVGNPEIGTIKEKIEIGCQYYALLGLGKMVVKFLGSESGEVELLSSHTDEGWKRKWGQNDKPVNYVTAGYIEAMFESVLNLSPKSFTAIETQSIVMGADKSVFKLVRR